MSEFIFNRKGDISFSLTYRPITYKISYFSKRRPTYDCQEDCVGEKDRVEKESRLQPAPAHAQTTLSVFTTPQLTKDFKEFV